MGIRERGPRRTEREIGRHLPRRRNMALANPRALNDPLVGGLNGTREFVVADDPSWQIDAAAEHNRT